jgi:hypothetical protein
VNAGQSIGGKLISKIEKGNMKWTIYQLLFWIIRVLYPHDITSNQLFRVATKICEHRLISFSSFVKNFDFMRLLYIISFIWYTNYRCLLWNSFPCKMASNFIGEEHFRMHRKVSIKFHSLLTIEIVHNAVIPLISL